MYPYLAHMARRGATNLHPGGAAAYAELAAALALAPGQRVLEIGCGTGATMVRVLADWDVDLTGVDVLPEMVTVARWRLRVTGFGRKARVLPAVPGERLPFANESFDRVYLEGALGFQDADASAAMLAELHRVLKPGGRGVANEAVWKSGVPDSVVGSIYASSVRDFGICQASEQNWTVREWCEAMARGGFEMEEAAAVCPSRDREPEPIRARVRLRRLISACFSYVLRCKAAVSPGALSRQRHYRTLLQLHSRDDRFIEGRLFVLKKPWPALPLESALVPAGERDEEAVTSTAQHRPVADTFVQARGHSPQPREAVPDPE
jgi:SAM-dependent methyltransferase